MLDFVVLDKIRARLKSVVVSPATLTLEGVFMHTRQRRAAVKRASDTTTASEAISPTPDLTPNYAHEFSALEVFPGTDRGPFSPAVNHALSTAFGESLEGLSVTRAAGAFNDALGARASAVGSHIFLNDDITESLASPQSMEIIAHEVAHALRPSSRTKALSDSGDAAEHTAHDAGRAVRGGLERGNIVPGSARASTGGEAVVQRWESFEHKRSVDQAIQNLGPGAQVDPAVAAQLNAKIKLANGLEVSPGQITALMGDLYGRFDEKTGMLDPKASFDQLNNADPKEMNKLLGLLAREDAGEEIAASEWEGATRNRRGTDGSYLELAQRNDSHFSADKNTGTDNNLGTYAAFHQMALEAAAKGDMNTARALEASSMHYLTDRHAGGHNMNKADVMAASGHDPGGVLANMAVKTAHDDLNNNGTTVANASGDSWRAYGDGMWESDENAENRRRTAQSVYTSWNELTQAGAGSQTPAELEKAGFGAFETVPQWDQQRQEGSEAVARNTSIGDMLWNYGGDAPDAIWGKTKRWFGKNIENPVSDAWDWTKDKAGKAWDWTTEKASDAWDWTKDKAGRAANWIGDTASGAWDWTKETAGQATDWIGDKASSAWDWTKETASDAGNWIGDQAQSAWNAAGDAASWAGDKASNAADWVGDKASGAANWVDDHFTLDPREMEFRPWKWF
jgi:hypothetical protein